MKVLITGANGYVGRRLAAGLSHHTLRLGDLDASWDERAVPLDVTRLEDCVAATAGMDAVVHLAVASGHEGDAEDDAFNQTRFDVNVKGTWNVLEAARRAGVRRVVHTSSIMVTWGYGPIELIAADAPARPVGTYALTKHLSESVCEHFARNYEMSIVCLRIAKPIDTGEPRWKAARIRPQWAPFTDLVRAYDLALSAPDIGFEIVTIVGASSRTLWDLHKAKSVLGYEPSMRLEELGYQLGDVREPF